MKPISPQIAVNLAVTEVAPSQELGSNMGAGEALAGPVSNALLAEHDSVSRFVMASIEGRDMAVINGFNPAGRFICQSLEAVSYYNRAGASAVSKGVFISMIKGAARSWKGDRNYETKDIETLNWLAAKVATNLTPLGSVDKNQRQVYSERGYKYVEQIEAIFNDVIGRKIEGTVHQNEKMGYGGYNTEFTLLATQIVHDEALSIVDRVDLLVRLEVKRNAAGRAFERFYP